jgi:hypothetical protein
MEQQKMILLEFNELCPALLKQWMSEGRLPNFKKFYERSHVFTAQADDDNPAHWEPWIQWYSIHTGLSYSQHGVFHLADGPVAGHDDVWQMLARNGYSVANCGSMNAKALHGSNCFFVPDPWCRTESPYPDELRAYYDMVTRLVYDSSQGRTTALPISAYVKFLKFMLGHGLSLATVKAVFKQLWSDTIFRQPTGWKRAAILDKLQFDVFRDYWRQNHPQFSTFFLNSTAHYQHAYWHVLFPDTFEPPIQLEAPAGARDAILFGYQQMDALLERFSELQSDGALLVLCTALSQQANPNAGKVFYRPRDAAAFLRSLDIECQELLPVMAHQYSARFADKRAAENARVRLMSLQCEGKRLIDIADSPEGTVFFGVCSGNQLPPEAMIQGKESIKFRFHDHFYLLPTIKSGTHHPDSILWINTGQHKMHLTFVSILDILPTILDFYRMDLRGMESSPSRIGRSLWPLMSPTLNGDRLERALVARSS